MNKELEQGFNPHMQMKVEFWMTRSRPTKASEETKLSELLETKGLYWLEKSESLTLRE